MVEVTRRGLLNSGALATLAVSTPAAAIATQSAPTQVSPRERLLMDFNWRFALGHASDMARDFDFGLDQRTFAKQGQAAKAAAVDFDDSAWRAVQLPHDWGVELPFAPTENLPAGAEEDPRAAHGFKPLGRQYPDTSVGWYRKSFDLPASDLGRRLSLEFDGVFRDALVMVNGYALFRNESGYAPFRVDITDVANYGGTNVVTVRVDATLGEGWFYEGAGLYRHVWLVKTAPLHVPQWGVFVRASPAGEGADLLISTEICNEGDAARQVEVRSYVLDAESRSVAQVANAAQVAPATTASLYQRSRIATARRWSINQPYLYTLRTEIWADGALIDAVTTPFGVRTTRFDPERGFFLNDQPLKLLGTCNHQDHAGIGTAVPDAILEFRIRKLKEMGSNAYRSAHNPPTPELLDICDRLGMLVIDETRPMASSPEGLSQLERMVRRDRNHPSVILWSIGNEEQAQQGTERGARIARAMVALVNRLDGTRGTTAALDQHFGEGISPIVDVLGFNYRTDQMAGYHARVPTQPIIGSETASAVSTRGEYVRDAARHIVPAYDTEHPWWATTSEFWWSIVADQPFNAGGFIWTGFDYRGEPTPYNLYPSISSYFGVMDTCGFPKDNYFYYKAWWRNEPLLHLFPHWDWAGREGELIDVWCHTNLDRVELFVNGVSQGMREVARNRHIAWQARYAPGVIEARGYKNGMLAQTVRRETVGAPARIVLRADRRALEADGEDAIQISAEIQDARGRFVARANDLVRFAITGPARIIGVGNGNPTSLEADKALERRAFNGLCAAIVQSEKRAGSVRISAQAAGLRSASLTLNAVAARARPAL